MSASPTAYTDQLVRTFIAQLRHSGLRHVVIAPGSRSTPLTVAFARDGGFTPWLHLDERSASYFALGLAREIEEPVALVCTSGTAAANFAPAVFEAWLSRVPLVVLTADRPPELRDTGANQTIDQSRVYGTHVKRAFELPIADGTEAVLRLARSTAARVVSLAMEQPYGPVHVNLPFREPLLDASTSLPVLPVEGAVEVPPVEPVAPSAETVAMVAELCAGRRGVIYCGPEPYALPAAAIASLADALGWPVLAEPLSGLRAGTHALDHVIETYDPLFRVPRFVQAAAAEVVLRFGAAATSRPAMGYLAPRAGLREIVVDVPGGWRDPEGSASVMVHADAGVFCELLEADLDTRAGAQADPAWLALWLEANAVANAAIRDAIEAMEEPFEGRVPVEVAEALPDGATLVVGNSMPVRDAESFFPALPRDVSLVGTRGASGIDGVVSTAVGAAAARATSGQGGPVVLLIGDLSFFHDLNGLWAVRRHGLSLTVVLVNNDGGGIFSFLSQSDAAKDEFEEWFGTPHGLDFRHAVALHGGRYERLDGNRGWAERIAAATREPGLTVLEVRTDRPRNVPLHREVWAQVGEAVGAVVDAHGGEAR
jgi:2-succinyl-5-enolpyruvyl-6-hydroxy-3-cyclohexene-1-carboxylate synthase